MPTLFRFLFVVAILAGLGFAAMFALATFVEPRSAGDHRAGPLLERLPPR